MFYRDGKTVRLGDMVEFDGGLQGEVVCSIDSEEYAPNYPEDAWAYLKKGILVLTEEVGLVHLGMRPDDMKRVD